MLKAAQLYSEQLKIKFLEIAYDKKYMFYNSGWSEEYKPSDDNWGQHEFVSLVGNEVIGYIKYDINQRSNNITNMRIINFSDNKIAFSKDVLKVIKDIFFKYKYNKINFGVFIGNPAEKIYNKFIKKYGGKVIGTYKEETKLLDGNFYDLKVYEVFKWEYFFKFHKKNEKEE